MARKQDNLEMAADWLLLAGGLNWGLYLLSWDLASLNVPGVNIIYGVVGVAAIYKIGKMLGLIK